VGFIVAAGKIQARTLPQGDDRIGLNQRILLGHRRQLRRKRRLGGKRGAADEDRRTAAGRSVEHRQICAAYPLHIIVQVGGGLCFPFAGVGSDDDRRFGRSRCDNGEGVRRCLSNRDGLGGHWYEKDDDQRKKVKTVTAEGWSG
jgi:hypothetical protein